MDSKSQSGNLGDQTFQQELDVAALQGGSPTERMTSVFNKLGDIIQQHSSSPDRLKSLGSHLRDHNRSLIQSVIKS